MYCRIYRIAQQSGSTRESIVIPFRAVLEQVFNHISHFRCAGYMTASLTKDKPLLPLGMKDRIGQRFDFQNQQ
jgi:hypothetical protein